MQEHSKRIFVSNRLPFTVNPKTQTLSRGSGGLVSALLGVSLNEPFSWMGFETDPKTAGILREKSGEICKTLSCHPVLLGNEVYDRYYDGTANDLIWPLFHYENHIAIFDRENWNYYRQANQIMADEILKVTENDDTIWIHDFHFLLLPQMLKNKNPKLKIGFFLHIPFPCVEIFRQLPVREEVLKSLTACDLIGFHEYSYLRNFVMAMKAFLGVDATLLKAEIGNHTLNLGVYPISIDTEDFQKKAGSEKVKKLCKTYRESSPGMFKIVGIDRLDYTKGLALKLQGFQRALKKYPELIGKVSLMQVAVPSRQKVPFYAQIKKELDQLVGAINGEFGAPDYVPVQYIFKSIPEDTLLALYRRADAALITSKRDGMNLVAMEYVMAQDVETPGVLILSEFAGAASLLPDALIINPWDADIIADSIYRATTMEREEKYQRLNNLQQTLLKYSASKWAEGFLHDFESAPTEASSCLPLSPSAANWPSKFTRSLQNKKIRLVLDYDGTLAPLKPRPELATLDSKVRDLLLRLNEDLELFILSGRPRDFLDSQFGDLPISLVAEHGAYYRWAGQKWQSRVSSDIDSWYSEVFQVMSSYTDKVPFSFVEKKEAGVVWHYRQSPPDFAEFQAKKLDDELKTCLGNEPVAVMMGSKIVEAKATECNKGSFLRWLMQSSFKDTAFYICVGDDRTDEDMFKIVGEKGLSIKVGPEHTAANYRVLEQINIPTFLAEIHAYVTHQNSNLGSTHV